MRGERREAQAGRKNGSRLDPDFLGIRQMDFMWNSLFTIPVSALEFRIVEREWHFKLERNWRTEAVKHVVRHTGGICILLRAMHFPSNSRRMRWGNRDGMIGRTLIMGQTVRSHQSLSERRSTFLGKILEKILLRQNMRHWTLTKVMKSPGEQRQQSMSA